MATPYVTIDLEEVDSTQDIAAARLDSSSLPVLIVAKRQTRGRGRSGNEWWQASRGVAASLAFRDQALDVGEAFPLTVGLAVKAAVAAIADIHVDLKWPNDLEIGGSKVGGILVERKNDQTVVGCGLNLWWPDPPDGARGLFPDDPGTEVGGELSRGWATGLLSGAVVWDRAAYLAACSTIGYEITWDGTGRGRAVDVDPRGGLVVRTDGDTVTIRSGEVRAVRRAV